MDSVNEGQYEDIRSYHCFGYLEDPIPLKLTDFPRSPPDLPQPVWVARCPGGPAACAVLLGATDAPSRISRHWALKRFLNVLLRGLKQDLPERICKLWCAFSRQLPVTGVV